MKKSIVAIGVILTILIIVQSCKKDKADTNADDALFLEITQGGYSFYQNGNLLSGVTPSPHGSFKLRFNATALSALDSTGELPAGHSFPTGSVIVKDVINGSSVSLYAIMKKDPSNVNAGSGWLWAELNTDGSVVLSTGKKGDGCIKCHSGSPNRDLTRTFDLH